MIERITQIMEHEGLSPSKFADEIGIQRSAVSHILNGRNNASLDVLMKILSRFTYVDTDWLLFGKGEMERTIVSNLPVNPQNTPVNPSDRSLFPEYRKENGVDTPVNLTQPPVVERIIHQDNKCKKVTKIMIFYSDNTFDSFISEKSEKE